MHVDARVSWEYNVGSGRPLANVVWARMPTIRPHAVNRKEREGDRPAIHLRRWPHRQHMARPNSNRWGTAR
jgi:hypothetical protein